MKGVKTVVTMEKTLYLDLPEDTSDENILKEAERETILPDEALMRASYALKSMHVNIPKLDLKDWQVTSLKQSVIK